MKKVSKNDKNAYSDKENENLQVGIRVTSSISEMVLMKFVN